MCLCVDSDNFECEIKSPIIFACEECLIHFGKARGDVSPRLRSLSGSTCTTAPRTSSQMESSLSGLVVRSQELPYGLVIFGNVPLQLLQI